MPASMAASAHKFDKFPQPRRGSGVTVINSKSPNAAGNFPDVPSDIIVNVDGVSFPLHKFPLFSKSGKIRRLAEELIESDSLANPIIEFMDFPGGPDTFELAAKFCYGIDFDMTVSNIAQIRCAAEFLEMTDNLAEDNLISCADSVLEDIIMESVANCTEVLHACDDVLLWAEETKIVNRCIDAIASKVCTDQKRLDYDSSGRLNKFSDAPSPLNVPKGMPPGQATVDWWAADISSLRIDIYQRLLAAMKSRGLKIESLAGSIMHYAQKVISPLKKKQGFDHCVGRFNSNADMFTTKAFEHEQRILIETLVSMLPEKKNLFPTKFLLGLLRTAIILDTTVACQLDLERRISLQLERTLVDDLLIPAYSHPGDCLFDIDIVQRVVTAYMQQDDNQEKLSSSSFYDTDDFASPASKGLTKIAKLIDMYLAEIAPDINLKVSQFLSLAELLPEHSRVHDDGLYRAVDIFFKAHPSLPDAERRKVCNLIDCQKLSEEACRHAAQNERLPVEMVVQVLYFEQMRMRTAMTDQQSQSSGDIGAMYNGGAGAPRRRSYETPSASPAIARNLQKENKELRIEVARLRLKIEDLERENSGLKQQFSSGSVSVSGGRNGSRSNFSLRAFSRKLGRFSLFAPSSAVSSASSASPKPLKTLAPKTPRYRRHSLS